MIQNSKKNNNVINNVTPVAVEVSKLIEEKSPDINYAETNNFDLEEEKKPALSTLRRQLKTLNKLSASTITIPIINEFDRIKIAINLEKYGEQIDFIIIDLEETNEPRKTPYLRFYEQIKKLKEEYIELHPVPAQIADTASSVDSIDEFEDEEALDLITLKSSDDEVIRELARELDEQVHLYNKLIISSQASTGFDYANKNYGISWKKLRDLIGLNNLYIENKYLVIDITGKFMASAGYLGKIDRHNILGVLQRILDLNVISFDIEKFYNVAQIFLCDVCLDIEAKSGEKVCKFIEALGSLFPISTNRHNIWKFHRSGLMLRSKAQKAGESLGIYHKGEELSYQKNTRYLDIIGESGQELAKRTLRIEHHLQTLEKIRRAFNIELVENGVVLLKDVLESHATPIIEMFKKFGAEPKYLREKIAGWIDEEPEFDTNVSEELLEKIMIAERFIEILIDNDFDLARVRCHLKIEYSRRVSDKDLAKFNEYAKYRDRILSFLVYKKPKSITLVLELLEQVYKYYGLKPVEDSDNV